MRWIILTAVLALGLPNSRAVPAQKVLTAVTGGVLAGERNGAITSYKGIPFAAPPVGPLRWRPPQPVPPWTGVRPATQFAPAPLQSRLVATLLGVPWHFSEDCLYLNVWTPATNATQRLPVMVWLYGGAFNFGSTAQPLYDGTHLAEQGVVVVSVAYRLGVFGFLVHPELTQAGAPGNFGIRDQIAGLQWVHDNIASFGGDPGQVTLFGESAGGLSVGLLVTSPQARGLFQRVIAESGALAPQKKLAAAEPEGVAFFAKLKVKDLAAARALPARDILNASFFATVTVDEELFAPDPYQCLKAGQANSTPILLGFNSDDGGLFVWGRKTPADFTNGVRQAFGENAGKVLALYPHANQPEATHSAKAAFRDVAFAWPVWQWASLQTELTTNAAFVYLFDQHSSFWQPDGAMHAAELGYVFDNLKWPNREAAELAGRMSRYWVNFARTGNPNGPGLPAWSPFNRTNHDFMYFGGPPRMAPMLDLPQIERLAPEIELFWKTGPGR